MENFEQGDQILKKEGVVPPTEAHEAVEAHQEVLNEIDKAAKEALSLAGDDFDTAIEGAESLGNTELVEKLQVMRNLASTE